MNKKSQYKSIARHFKNDARKNKYQATAYVEYKDDVRFWKKILENYPLQFKYYVQTSKENKASGSGQCLLFHQYQLLSKNFFICIDSDFRYIFQSGNINVENFIFQTYTYSIENHICYAPFLNQILANKNMQLFDFESFLLKYSVVIFELFSYLIHSLSINDKALTLAQFSDIISLKIPPKIQNDDSIATIIEMQYENIRQNIEVKCTELRQKYQESHLKNLRLELDSLGIYPNNCYLFIRGHNLYDEIIKPILGKIKNKVIHNEIDNTKKSELQKINWHDNLLSNFTYFNYPEINKIQKDIQLFFC